MSIKEKAANATAELVKEIYVDALKPATAEVGKTAGGLARIVLSPFNGVIWGYEQIVNMLEEKLSEKLAKVSPDKITVPQTNIAVPTLEALRYNGEIDELRNLYLNLLANSMNLDCKNDVHPSFVDIIKNLSPDEAQLLSAFEKSNRIPFITIKEVSDKGSFIIVDKHHTHIVQDYGLDLINCANMPVYMDNLIRVGVIAIPEGYISNEDMYSKLELCENVQDWKRDITSRGYRAEIMRGFFEVTDFGLKFIDLVVKN